MHILVEIGSKCLIIFHKMALAGKYVCTVLGANTYIKIILAYFIL